MPDSYLISLAGGVLIGLATGGLYLIAGEIAGITGIARVAMNGALRTGARIWAMTFLAGMLAAGLMARAIFGADALTAGIETISLPMLVLAGLLVGVGTDLGNGCTSGHGVCGLSRFSPRSLAAVLTFMASAGVTLYLVRHVLVSQGGL